MRSLPYPKIETLFNRDKDTFKVLTGPGDFRRVEFDIINPWIVTEKIDGTNIRLHFSTDDPDTGAFVRPQIGGRTDRAQLPPKLADVLSELVARIYLPVQDLMREHELEALTIYGEGYGAGIQKAGGNYRSNPGFIAFDMLADNKYWLSFDQARNNAAEFGLDFTPMLGLYTADLAARLVRWENWQSHFGDFKPEGIVARPIVELYNSRGQRVMWKLKVKDF